jgi:hypothetical protein
MHEGHREHETRLQSRNGIPGESDKALAGGREVAMVRQIRSSSFRVRVTVRVLRGFVRVSLASFNLFVPETGT